MRFKRCPSDNSIWVWAKDKVKVIIPVYVDDLTLACNNLSALNELKSQLKAKFEMRDLGELKYILGLEIKRDRSKQKIYVSQHKHTLDILRRFNHDHSRPVVTPLDSTTTLSKVENMSQEEKDYMSNVPYLSAVGSLMYLAIGSRPDIAFAVGLLSRFNSCPAKVHWNAIQHVFKYLKGTVDFGLEFGPSGSGGVVSSVFSDSDYQGTLKRLDLHLDMPLSLVPPVLTGQVGVRTQLQSPPLKQNSLLPMLELQMELGCLIYSKNLAILNPLHSTFIWTINLPSRLQEIQNIMEG